LDEVESMLDKLRALTCLHGRFDPFPEHHFLESMKKYAIFCKHRKSGQYFGYIERSFAMDISPERVRVWNAWEEAAHSMKSLLANRVCLNGDSKVKLLRKDYEFVAVRVDSAKCHANFSLLPVPTPEKNFDRRNWFFHHK